MQNTSLDLLRPLFVIGNPRSGTSMLRLMLTCHRSIIVPPECGFILWLETAHGNWTANDADDTASVASFVHDLLDCRKFDTWGLNGEMITQAIVNTRPTNYASLCACVVSAYALSQGRTPGIWGDKNNFHISRIVDLHRLFPAARFLHIVRDGRDVACSYRSVMETGSDSPYAPRLATTMTEIAREWSSNVDMAEKTLSDFPPEQHATVTYENLASHPESTLEKICAWLELPFDPEMLNFHSINKAYQLEPASTMDWKARTMKPVSSDTVGQYATVLNNAEIEEFERVAGPTLHSLGYILASASA